MAGRQTEDLILLLFVDSILKSGILGNNLTSPKSNSELVRSLETLLESALACPRHPSTALPSASSSPSSSAASSEDAIYQNISLTRPDPVVQEECEAIPSYTYMPSPNPEKKPSILTIPAREAIHQEPAVKFSETREALEVTAKFFYLPHPSASASASAGSDQSPLDLDPSWIQESLEHLRVATGLNDIDTFIISFPGLAFDESSNPSTSGSASNSSTSSDCCSDGNARPNGTIVSSLSPAELEQKILDVWRAASGNKRLKSLGVSEFSLDRLKWLLHEAGGAKARKGVVDSPSGLRRPRVGQVNTRNSCDVPSNLVEFAKKEDIDLLVHSDCSDFLPPKTFTGLLARHGTRLPSPLLSDSPERDSKPASEAQARQTLSRLSARWVLKYTVLIRDRAVVVDKGYLVKASRLPKGGLL